MGRSHAGENAGQNRPGEREWRIAGASVTQLTRNQHLAPKRKPAIYLTQFNARR